MVYCIEDTFSWKYFRRQTRLKNATELKRRRPNHFWLISRPNILDVEFSYRKVQYWLATVSELDIQRRRMSSRTKLRRELIKSVCWNATRHGTMLVRLSIYIRELSSSRPKSWDSLSAISTLLFYKKYLSSHMRYTLDIRILKQ